MGSCAFEVTHTEVAPWGKHIMLTFSQALSCFCFLICPLPCAKSAFLSVQTCVHSYICVYGVGDLKGMGEFNHILTDVCSIDLWLFCEHCFRTFGRDINPSIKATSPEGLHRTNSPHPICVSKSMCVFFGEYKGEPEVLVKPLTGHSQGKCIDLYKWKWSIPPLEKANLINKQKLGWSSRFRVQNIAAVVRVHWKNAKWPRNGLPHRQASWVFWSGEWWLW